MVDQIPPNSAGPSESTAAIRTSTVENGSVLDASSTQFTMQSETQTVPVTSDGYAAQGYVSAGSSKDNHDETEENAHAHGGKGSEEDEDADEAVTNTATLQNTEALARDETGVAATGTDAASNADTVDAVCHFVFLAAVS